MIDSAERDAVAQELERLSRAGSPLDTDSPHATEVRYSGPASATRAADFAEEFMALQPSVSTSGGIVVVTAGAPGAGKSTTLEAEGLLTSSHRNLDADIIKDLILHHELSAGNFDELLEIPLPGGRRLRPLELASLVHKESLRVMEVAQEIAIDRGEDLVIQGTLRWDGMPSQLSGAIARGAYDELTIINIELPLEQSLAQALSRWWADREDASNLLGGRFVPERFIRDLYSSRTCVCSANAERMYEISPVAYTRMLSYSRAGRRASRIEKHKSI